MTWLSRLLPQTPSLHRHAATRNRSAKQRRRVMTLESLEQRVVLSNVSATFSAGVLCINADQFNNSFKITETTAAAGGKVTVSSLTPSTTINNTAAAFQTTAAVTAIKIKLVGTTDSDIIQIVAAGKTTATTVKTIDITADKTALTLMVGSALAPAPNNAALGVDNTGAFSLTTNGKLNAKVLNSTFTALSIDQSNGCCVANVELGNDAIAGSVYVAEGGGDGDVINAHDSKFGSTSFSQGKGNNDYVYVNTSPNNTPGSGTNALLTAKDLTVCQGNGNNDHIEIDHLRIAATSFGVVTSQGDGWYDDTSINDVKVTGVIPNNPQIIPSIYVNQGNGFFDTASVTNSVIPGNIAICQGDGSYDIASISDSAAGFSTLHRTWFGTMSIHQGNGTGDQAYIFSDGNAPNTANNVYICQGDGDNDIAQVTDSTVYGCVTITQGCGDNDNALVSGVTASGDISICQGNGDVDVAQVLGSSAAGYAENVYDNAGNLLYVIDFGGNICITQGDGYGDTATLDGDTANNVYITQGDNCYNPDCNALFGDTVNINDSTITSDIEIHQGSYKSDGGYYVNIGDQSPVTAGGYTLICQNGSANYVTLGNADNVDPDTGFAFSTAYLDVYTGCGGAFVMATNTNVDWGSYFGYDYTIDGGGWGNVYYDAGGNSGVTASGNFDVV